MLPNTLTIAIPERIGADILAACPHLAASTGSACHSGQVTPSATLLAIGATPDVAAGTIRLTLGRHTTTEQIQSAAHMVADAATS